MSKMEGSILIVDDDEDVLLSARLYLEQYFQKVVALNKPTDLLPTLLEHPVDVALLDMNYRRGRNDGGEGLHWLKRVKEQAPQTEVVVMTAYAEVGLAVEAIKAGALDFVVKPWSNEKLLATIMTALELSKSRREVEELKRQQEAWNRHREEMPEMIGESEAIQSVKHIIEQVAPTDANVLILGENGTGKEIVAQHIHRQSLRSDQPFVKVDLGALHQNLFESELFGAKKGAYTDLKEDKVGRFELAHKGTLFLDEIANLDLTLQSKLLSVLQNREIYRVGSNAAQKVNVRVVCATNATLDTMVAERAFRQDLLYRINTIEVTVPPLRERLEDLPLLGRHFMERFGQKYKKSVQMDSSEWRSLQKYDWPGNVREFQHAIERAVIMSKTGKLRAADVMAKSRSTGAGNQVPRKLEELERWHISRVLDQQKGNISHAAQELGITRAALYRRMEKYGL